MKKIIVSLALLAVFGTAFGQKKVVRSAENNLKKGNYEEALTEINEAIQNSETSGDPNTFFVKGKILTKAYEVDSSNTESTLKYGIDAFEVFKKAKEMDNGGKITKEIDKDVLADGLMLPPGLRGEGIPWLKYLSYAKALDAYEQEDMMMAYKFFKLTADIDPTDTTAVYNTAYTAAFNEDFATAKEYYKILIGNDEYVNPAAYFGLLGIVLEQEQNNEEALTILRDAQKDYPNEKIFSEYEISILIKLDRLDEAKTSIEESLEKDPRDPNNLLRYGYLWEQQGDLDKALEYYKKSAEVKDDFFDGNFYVGALLVDMAGKIVNEVNNMNDADWEKYSDSKLKEADDIYRESLKYFEKAIEINPDDLRALEPMYGIYNRLKQPEKAEAIDKRIQELKGGGN